MKTLVCENNSLPILDITKRTGLRTLYASGQTLMLPTVERIDDDKLSIKNPIMFVGAKAKNDNISHGSTYISDTITRSGYVCVFLLLRLIIVLFFKKEKHRNSGNKAHPID